MIAMKPFALAAVLVIAGEAMATEIPDGERKAFLDQFVKNCMSSAMTPAAVSRFGGDRIADYCACSAVGVIRKLDMETLKVIQRADGGAKLAEIAQPVAGACTLKLVGR